MSGNGSNGLYIANGTSDSKVSQNTFSGNAGYGIRANGYDVFGNSWTRNIIFANLRGGIITTSDANDAIKPPTLIRNGNEVTGMTRPGAIVELYSDDHAQGRIYETTVTADPSTGAFRAKRGWKGAVVNAFATDSDGNSSGFTINQGIFQVSLPLIQQ